VPVRSGTSEQGQRRLTVERPARECGSVRGFRISCRVGGAKSFSQKQKTFTPGKTENEGIRRIPPRTHGTGWPHPSLDGEVGPVKDRDEHNQADILTSGFDLAPAFPPARTAEWNSGLLGVCNPLQWRNRPRFSRGSLTPGSDDDGRQVHQTFKEHKLLTL